MSFNPLTHLSNVLSDKFIHRIDEDEFVSHPVSVSNKIFSKNSISNYIRPYKFHRKTHIFECNDNYSGVVLELNPRVRMGKDTVDTFKDVLESMPLDALVSVQLFGSKNNTAILNNWDIAHRYRQDEQSNYLVDLIAKFFAEKSNGNLTKGIKTNLKRHRVLISVKHKSVKTLVHYVDEMMRVLKSASFMPTYMTPKSLKPIYYEFLNDLDDMNEIPKYDRNRFFNKQCVSYNQVTQEEAEYIRVGRVVDKKFKGTYYKALALQDISDYFDIGEFSQKIGATVGSSGDVEGKQFYRNFIISLNLTKATPNEIKKIGINQTIVEKTVQTKDDDVDLKAQKKENRTIRHHLGNEDSIFKADITVIVGADTYEDLKESSSNVRQMWRKSGAEESGRIKLEPANNMHKNIFLSSLPLGLNDLYFTHVQDKPYFWNVGNVAQFLPVEGDWSGNAYNVLAVGRRGGLLAFDTFETSVNKNFYILGTSGAGKSNTLSWIIFNNHARGTRNFVIDVGASQEILFKYLGGEFLQPDLKSPISFNPFGNISNLEELKEEFGSFFSNWLYVVGGNKDEQTYKREQKFIKAKLEDVIIQEWEKANKSGRILEPTDIQREFMKLYEETKDSRYSDFATHLSPICNGGKYDKFFKGKSDFDIKKSELACLDLTLIQNEEELRDNLVFLMTFFFSEAIYKDHNCTQTQVIIDELHKHLGKDPRLEDEVDVAFRTYRKHGAGMGVGTQGFNDLVDARTGQGTKLGKSIIENSATQLFGKQTAVARNMLLNSPLMDFDEMDKDVLSNPPQGGGYKEFLIIDEHNNKIPIRFLFPKFFLWLCTTDPDEKPLLKRTIQQCNGDITKAINILIEKELQSA